MVSRRIFWIKTGVVLALIVLFFSVVNSFFRENQLLQEELVFWEEKANSFEAQYNKVLAENNALRLELDSKEKGLTISGIDLVAARFLPGDGNNLTYDLSIEVENTSTQNAEATAVVIFAQLQPGGKGISSTSWRTLAVPQLKPEEKRPLKISGKVSAQPKRELLIIVNILGEPGWGEKRVTLPERPAPPQPPPPPPPTVKKESVQESGRDQPSLETASTVLNEDEDEVDDEDEDEDEDGKAETVKTQTEH